MASLQAPSKAVEVDLSEFRAPSPSQRLTVAYVIDILPTGDAQALITALSDYSISVKAIRRWLVARDYEVPVTAISQYRYRHVR
jgi:hypothetical protein